MSNGQDYGIRFTGDATGAKAATTDVETGLARVSKSLRTTSDDAVDAKARWDALNDTHVKAAAGSKLNADGLKSLDDELAVLLARLDPAYRATKQFQDGQGVLTDGLKQNLITQQQYDGALASLTTRFGKSGEAAAVSALGTAQARRELIVLGHEAMTGNFSRMPGSFMVLANRMGATATMFGPITAGLVAVGAGAAVLGVMVAHAEEFNRVLNSMQVQLEATGRGSMMSNQDLTALIDQMAAMPGMSKDAAEKTLSVFAQTHAIGAPLFKDLALLVNDFAAATGETAPAAAKKLAAAFADPAAGAKTLEKEFGTLTASQVLNIEQMMKQNDLAGAQKALYDDLLPSIAGLAEKGLTPLQKATNGVGVAWDGLLKSMGDSSAIKGASAAVVGLVNGFAWMIDHADQVNKVLKMLPIVGPSIGVAEGGLSLAANLGTPKAGGATGTWPASSSEVAAKALDDQVKGALALGASYSTLTEKAQALQVTQTAIKAALDASTQSGDTTSAAFVKLSGEYTAVTKSVADAWRAAGAEGVALTNERIASALKLQDISIGSAQNELETELKLKQITKEQYDEANTGLLLSKNYVEQIAVQRKLDVAVMGQATDQQKLALQLQLDQLKAQAQAIAQKGSNQQLLDENDALLAQQAIVDKMTDGVNKLGAADLKRLTDSIAAQKLHNAEIGKTAEQIELAKRDTLDLGTTQMQNEADAIEAMLQEQKGNAAVLEVYGAMLESLKAQIAARRELSGVLTTGAQLAGDAAAAKAYQQAWQKNNDEVSRYLSDAIMRGFDKGQSFVKNFTTSLENAFKTMVLTPVIKFILSPVTGAITSAMTGMGLSGAANAAGSGSSLLSLASNASSLSGLSGATAGIASTIIPGTVPMAAAGATEIGAGAIAAGAGDAAVATGAGMSIGGAAMAAVPYVGLALAAAYALGLFGGKNDNAQPAGPPGTYFTNLNDVTSGGLGGGQNYWTAMGQRKDGGQYSTGPGTYGLWTPAQATAINSSIGSMFASYEAAAKDAGIATDALAGKFSSDASVAHSGATTADALTSALASLSDSIATALIPDIKIYQAQNETLAQTFTRLIGDVKGVQAIFDAIQNGVTATVDVSESLVSTFGGLANLQSQFSTYYNAFYTQAEKDALATTQVADAFASLNDAVPTSRDQFKALVNGLDLTTASGQTTFKVLMGIAPAFDQVATAAESAGTAATTLADQISATQTAAQAAVSAQISNEQTAASNAHQLATTYSQISTTLKTTIDSLTQGSLSPLDPAGKLAATQATLNSTYQAAMGGDTTALSALPQAAQDFLTASQAYNASSTQYAQDFNQVTMMLQAAQTASVAQSNASEHQGLVFDAQLVALNTISTELGKPSPDAAILQQQAALLGDISSYSNAQLQSLIATGVQGGSSLDSINAGIGSVVVLLKQWVDLQGQASAAAAAAAAQAVVGQAAADAARTAASQAAATTATATAAYTAEKASFDADLAQVQQQLTSIFGAGNWSQITAADPTTNNPGTVSVAYSSQSQLDALAALQPAYIAEVQKVYNLWKAIPGHASGLPYVPYDDYFMRAHKGEAVLTAPEAANWRSGGAGISSADLAALRQEIRDLRNENRSTPVTIQESGRDTVQAVKQGMANMSAQMAVLATQLRRVTV